MVESMDLKRAKNALRQVRELTDADDPKKYKSAIKGIPNMIRNNGVGQAVAFIMSKSKERQYQVLQSQLFYWLVIMGTVYIHEQGKDTLIDYIINSEGHKYIHATDEAILYTNWLAKSASAFIEDKKGEKEKTESEVGE